MVNYLAPFFPTHDTLDAMAVDNPYRGEYGSYCLDSIKNVRFSEAAFDGILVEWDIISPDDTLRVFVAFYVDGIFHSSTQGTEIVIGGLSTGTHSLLIRIEPKPLLGLWTWFNHTTGSRVKLDWSSNSQGHDVAKYLIYWDNATGSVSFTAAWATINQIEITHLLNAAPDSGSGTGFLSSYGTYGGGKSYCSFDVVIDTAGAINEFGDGADVTTDYDTLNPIKFNGGYNYLDDGISVAFSNDSSAFVVNDTWALTFDCRQWYRHTKSLDDGTYKFVIRSSDGINESNNTTLHATVAINGIPPEATNLAISGYDRKATITGTVPNIADLDSLIIVSNCGHTDEVPDRRFLHSAYATMGLLDPQTSSRLTGLTPGGSFSYTTGDLTAGEWEFLVLTVDTAGNFSDGITLLEIEFSGSPAVYVLHSPAPTGLDAVQLAGGNVRLDFNLYGKSTDTDRTITANIYHDAGTGTVDYGTIIGTVTNTQAATWTKHSYTLTGLVDGTSYKIGVRAVSSTGDEETNTTTVTCKSDASAPVAPWGCTATVER